MATADIIAQSRDGKNVLLVEAKNKRGTSADWAAQMRRNLMAHYGSAAPFFLLATPDRFYFWFDRGPANLPTPPDLTLDSSQLLRPHLKAADISGESLSAASFELIVESWLRELVHNSFAETASSYPEELVSSGLLHALRGANLIQHHES